MTTKKKPDNPANGKKKVVASARSSKLKGTSEKIPQNSKRRGKERKDSGSDMTAVSMNIKL